MPKDLDSIIFTMHLQLIQGMLLAMGMTTVDIFDPPIGYWHRRGYRFDEWRKQRIVDYYEHVDSDWIQFYSANQIVGILLQARGQCQAHLQRHSRHISHALHVYEVNHGRFLISLTLLSCEDKEWQKLTSTKIGPHSITLEPQSSMNLKSGELFLASGQKSLSLTPDDMIAKGCFMENGFPTEISYD
jgi:hypothetical protein